MSDCRENYQVVMKVVLALCFLAVAAQAAVKPRDIEIPEWQLNPRLSGAEWQQILANQEFTPEVVEDFKAGTEPQIDGAGAIRGESQDPKIVGGSSASSGQFPWQVSVTMDGSYFCGGTIISNRWILTAGHCVDGITSFKVVAGSLNPNGGTSGSTSQTSRSHILHSGYNSNTIANDIALIQLPSALSFSSLIGPARLPKHSQASNTFAGQTARVSGWGKTSDSPLGGISSSLNYVDLPVITNAVCAQTYGATIRATNICTSGAGGHSTCSGDSGGPLVLRESDGLYTHIGIVSFGSSAGCALGYPAAFTRTTSFLSWIESNSGIVIG